MLASTIVADIEASAAFGAGLRCLFGRCKVLRDQMYLDDVVFSMGIDDAGDHFIVASGEADLACRAFGPSGSSAAQ